jgi:hypothetical protein
MSRFPTSTEINYDTSPKIDQVIEFLGKKEERQLNDGTFRILTVAREMSRVITDPTGEVAVAWRQGELDKRLAKEGHTRLLLQRALLGDVSRLVAVVAGAISATTASSSSSYRPTNTSSGLLRTFARQVPHLMAIEALRWKIKLIFKKRKRLDDFPFTETKKVLP